MLPKLVQDWRDAWKWLSVQLAAAAVVFGLLPPDQQGAILEWLGIAPERIPAAIGAAFILGRLLRQKQE